MSAPRQTPSSPEMEAATLGAMIGAEWARNAVLEEYRVTAAMFERPDYRRVFETVVQMHERGDKIDELSVPERMKVTGRLVDGLKYSDVASLYERCPAVANVRAYATEVRDLAILRSLIRRGEQISALGFERPAEPVRMVRRWILILAIRRAPEEAQTPVRRVVRPARSGRKADSEASSRTRPSGR